MSNLYFAKITKDFEQNKTYTIEGVDSGKGFCVTTFSESELVEIHNALSYMIFTTDARAKLLQSGGNELTNVSFYCAKLENIRIRLEHLLNA